MLRPLTLAAFLTLTTAAHAGTLIPLENADFEDGTKGWTGQPKGNVTIAAIPEAASMGRNGLRVTDADTAAGGHFFSTPAPVQPKHAYQLIFWGKLGSETPGLSVGLEYRATDGSVLKGEKSGTAWGSTSVKYRPGFQHYIIESIAPEGAAALVVKLETYGRSTTVSDIDDLRLDDVTDGKPTPVDLDALIARAKASPTGKPLPKVVIKIDDLKHRNDRIFPKWQKVVDFAKERKIKASLGIIANSLEGEAPNYFKWIKDLHATGQFEFWNHGYDHAEWTEGDKKLQEFKGATYEHQKKHMTDANRLAREKLGFPFRSFGAPFNSTDEITTRVLDEDPDIQVIMYGNTERPTKKTVLGRIFAVSIENPTFIPNYEMLVQGYLHNRDQEVVVLQGHPNNWDDTRFNNFAKIVDFLLSQGATFALPSEFAKP